MSNIISLEDRRQPPPTTPRITAADRAIFRLVEAEMRATGACLVEIDAAEADDGTPYVSWVWMFEGRRFFAHVCHDPEAGGWVFIRMYALDEGPLPIVSPTAGGLAKAVWDSRETLLRMFAYLKPTAIAAVV